MLAGIIELYPLDLAGNPSSPRSESYILPFDAVMNRSIQGRRNLEVDYAWILRLVS